MIATTRSKPDVTDHSEKRRWETDVECPVTIDRRIGDRAPVAIDEIPVSIGGR